MTNSMGKDMVVEEEKIEERIEGEKVEEGSTVNSKENFMENSTVEDRVEELRREVMSLTKKICMLDSELNSLKSKTDFNNLCDFKIGDTFELAGLTWKVLDIEDGRYKCLADKLDGDMTFRRDSGDWTSSGIRRYLNNDVYNDIVEDIDLGNRNIKMVGFDRDLTSLDGHTDYGTVRDHVSLLTIDEYRKYRELIPDVRYWWWLVTPWSTVQNAKGFDKSVVVVSTLGCVEGTYCDGEFSVRPFCVFESWR